MGIEPKVKTESEPISEVAKVTTITNPVGQKNVAGTQVNPATEDTLALVKTAVEIIDNFISGTKGLVTEDNSAAIKTAIQALRTADTLDTIKAAVNELKSLIVLAAGSAIIGKVGIDQTTPGTTNRVSAVEDNSAATKASVETIDNFISGARGLVTEDNSGSILAQLNITLSALRDALRGTGKIGRAHV